MVRLSALSLVLLATPALADQLTGTVIAFDRVAHVIVFEDKSVLTVPNPEIIPADLEAGDVITVDFKTEGDSGYGKISKIAKQ